MTIKDELNEKMGYTLLFDDITQINNLQKELEKLNQSLENKVNLRTIQLQEEIEKQILQRKKYQTFDAMTSQRPYNIIKTHEEALYEIVSCSEKQYDMTIVKIFQELVKNNEIS